MFGINRVYIHEITQKHVSRHSVHIFLKLYPGLAISQEEDVCPNESISMLMCFCAILNIWKGQVTGGSTQVTIDMCPLAVPGPSVVVYTRFRKGIKMIEKMICKIKFN